MHTLRLAERADLAGVFHLYDEHVLRGTCTFETIPKTPAERDAWFDAHPPARHPLLVASSPDHPAVILGWAALAPWSPRQAYARTAENSVYVDPAHRGRGLAHALLADLMARALRDTPVRVFVARIVQPNPASVRLHERLGFRQVGLMQRCGEKFGRLLDVLLMERHLDDPPTP